MLLRVSGCDRNTQGGWQHEQASRAAESEICRLFSPRATGEPPLLESRHMQLCTLYPRSNRILNPSIARTAGMDGGGRVHTLTGCTTEALRCCGVVDTWVRRDEPATLPLGVAPTLSHKRSPWFTVPPCSTRTASSCTLTTVALHTVLSRLCKMQMINDGWSWFRGLGVHLECQWGPKRVYIAVGE